MGRYLPAVPDMHHIAILRDVILAFEPQSALGPGVGLRAGFQ